MSRAHIINAAIGTACAIGLIATVMSAARGHEWYSGLKSPLSGISCCNDRDCAPTDGCILPNGTMGILAQQGCIEIDQRKVLDQPSPDGRLHLCQAPPQEGSAGVVFCIIMGGGV
jgi:hypothetical protein